MLVMRDPGRLFVAGVVLLICFIAYSSQIFIFWDYLGGLNVKCLTILIPFNIFVLFVFWSYYLVCVTDPGKVPNGWAPEDQNIIELKRTTRAPRYCRTCKNYKPPRSHHCKSCRRCVLKMDHHCPWTNNCIGYYNYGHFMRFLFWVDVACIYHFTLLLKKTFQIIEDMANVRYIDEPTTFETIIICLNFVAVLPVLFGVGPLSLYHFYCASANMTTIESWEKEKVATMVRRGKIKEVKYPYDIGCFPNIQAVLGKNPLLWCFPQSVKGDGLVYPISKDADDDILWPPKDPEKKAASLPPKPWDVYNPQHLQAQNKPNHTNRAQHKRRKHRRRDSEGYVVPDITMEERQMWISDDQYRRTRIKIDETSVEGNNTFDSNHNSDGSTLYSSGSEYSDGDFEDEISDTDEFNDENYPEHIGVGTDEEQVHQHSYSQHQSYYYQNSAWSSTREQSRAAANAHDDDDDNIPIGLMIGQKQLEAMGLKPPKPTVGDKAKKVD